MAVHIERTPGNTSSHAVEMTADKLAEFLEEERGKGRRPTSLAAAPQDGKALFAAVVADDSAKLEWETDLNLTARSLSARASAMAKRGFAPAILSAYPLDGEVRYCVVWIKEPPRSVSYPKQPTLVELPGWQILTNANKDEMQKWLDERKKDHHSVVWIDSTQLGEKAVFSAVAALDAREPRWKVVFDTPAASITPAQLQKQSIDTQANYVVAASGYEENEKSLAVLLWWPESRRFAIVGDDSTFSVIKNFKEMAAQGYKARLLRPNLASDGTARWVAYIGMDTKKTEFACELSDEALTTFLDKSRSEALMPTSIAGWLKDGIPTFAAVVRSNPTKWEWQVDKNLTTVDLKTKAQAISTKGFRPSCVTAYLWDGAVRYCVIWVKEPPKPAP